MAAIPTQIIGHGKQCGQLLQDIAKNNIAHAYMFTGPKHIGKFSIARWFAWQLLSEGLPPSAKPGVRDQMERLIHPDFLCLDQLWIEDINDDWSNISKHSNIAQSHRAKPPKARTDSIGIDEVRAMQERLYDTGSSRYFACVIRSVERMQPAAANALLKVLEEPPPRVVFVLTAESDTKVLSTVVSRARVLKFHVPDIQELRPLVANADPDDAAFVLHLCQGAPGKAIRLLQDPDLLRQEKQLHMQARQFWRAQNAYERLPWIHTFLERPEQADVLLLHLGLTLRETAASAARAAHTAAYMELVGGLRTNAHRGLLLQRFVLALEAE